MGKKTYVIDGDYYIIDDETLAIKHLVVKDEVDIPPEVYKKLLAAVIADTRPFTPK